MQAEYLVLTRILIVEAFSGSIDEYSDLVEYEGLKFYKELIKSYLEGRYGGFPVLREAVSYGQEKERL